jgi:hypothetical protein
MDDQAHRFENVIAEIYAEMRVVRVELERLRTLDNAILAARDPTMWLNQGVYPRGRRCRFLEAKQKSSARSEQCRF